MNDPKWNGGHYYDSDFPIDGTVMARYGAEFQARNRERHSKLHSNFTFKMIHPAGDTTFNL